MSDLRPPVGQDQVMNEAPQFPHVTMRYRGRELRVLGSGLAWRSGVFAVLAEDADGVFHTGRAGTDERKLYAVKSWETERVAREDLADRIGGDAW